MTQTALVVGASGIVGSAITQLLLENDWQVAALSRSPSARPGVTPVAADLQ
ncbi:NAD-dependent epimerase/dehydratase family protein, partial [Pseudomonas ficuserectae]